MKLKSRVSLSCPVWAVCVLVLSAQLTPSQGLAATRVQSPVRQENVHEVTVSDLGYAEGLVSDELESAHTLFFPVPKGATITSSWLSFDYSRSPLLRRPSNLRVLVNGTPRAAVAIHVENPESTDATATRQLIVPLTAKDLRGDFVRVVLRSSAIISDDICLDERMRAGFIHFKPTSSIHYKMTAQGDAIETFFQLLPHRVTISLGTGIFTADQFHSALRLMRLLEAAGHDVELTRLPKRGEIILASVKDYMALVPGALAPQADRNLQLVGTNPTRSLLISEPFTPGLEILSRRWLPLLVAPSYLSHFAADNPELVASGSYEIPFSALGLGDTLREAYSTADWRFSLSPRQLPRAYRPTAIEIDIISTPGLFDRPVLFYAFVNGILLKVERLPDDGEVHRFTVDIPDSYTQNQNEIRLMALRSVPVGKCGADMIALRYPVQILPSSRIITKRFDRKPETFSDLSTVMQTGVQIYLSPKALEQPTRTLTTLARITRALQLESSQFKLEVAQNGKDIKPSGPFIVIGGKEITGFHAPVRLDQGKVEIRNQQNDLLLDVSALPDLNIVQIAEKSGHYGLWLSSDSAELPSDPGFRLTSGDVAFLGKGRLVLSLDTRLPSAGRVEYPGSFKWGAFLYHYRWFIFLGLWLVLTIAFLAYYRKNRHKDVA